MKAEASSLLNAIMTRDEVAAWLKVHPRQLDRLRVPRLDLGHKTKRYVVKDVVEWLDAVRGKDTRGTRPRARRRDGLRRGNTDR